MEIAIGTGIYYALNNRLKKIEKNTKIRNNYISIIHVLFTLCTAIYSYSSGNQTNELYRGNTVGFFINEMIFFLNKKLTMTAMTLIIHHLMMISLLYNCSENSTIINNGLVIGELSNLTGNIIYHRLHIKDTIKDTNNIIKKKCCDKELYYLQFVLYFFLRILVPPYYILKEFSSEEGVSNMLKTTMILLYIMGIIWLKKLYINCEMLYYEKNYKKIKT